MRPAPLAGLQHLEIVKVGQQVVFDARLSVVAALQGDEGASPEPGARLTGYRFTIADGSPIVEQTAPTLSRSFTEPGIYAVSLTIVDDRGEQSTVQSSVHVQPDFAPSCAPDALQACVSGRCAGGACVAMACAGQEVCALAGGDLSCRQGRCEKGAVAP